MVRNRSWRSILILLGSLIHEVALLTSHGVVDAINAGLVGHRLDDRLQPVLQLLIVKTHAGCYWRYRRLDVSLLLAEVVIDVHLLELLSSGSNVDELLLQTHLLLCQVLVGSHELSVQIWIHLRVTLISYNRYRWGCQNLLGEGVHLTIAAHAVAVVGAAGKIGASGRLWHATARLYILRSSISAALEPKVLLDQGWRSGSGERGRFGCSSEACQEVGAAGSGCWIRLGL